MAGNNLTFDQQNKVNQDTSITENKQAKLLTDQLKSSDPREVYQATQDLKKLSGYSIFKSGVDSINDKTLNTNPNETVTDLAQEVRRGLGNTTDSVLKAYYGAIGNAEKLKEVTKDNQEFNKNIDNSLSYGSQLDNKNYNLYQGIINNNSVIKQKEFEKKNPNPSVMDNLFAKGSDVIKQATETAANIYNTGQITSTTANALGSAIPTIGVSLATGGGAAAIGASALAKKVATTATTLLGEAGFTLADNVSSALDQTGITNMSVDDLKQTSIYKEGIFNNVPDNKLKDAVVTKLAIRAALSPTTVASVITSAAQIPLASSSLTKTLTPTGIKKSALDIIGEGVSEASTQLGANQVTQENINPEQSLTEGLGEAFAQGVIGAAGINTVRGTVNLTSESKDKVKETFNNYKKDIENKGALPTLLKDVASIVDPNLNTVSETDIPDKYKKNLKPTEVTNEDGSISNTYNTNEVLAEYNKAEESYKQLVTSLENKTDEDSLFLKEVANKELETLAFNKAGLLKKINNSINADTEEKQELKKTISDNYSNSLNDIVEPVDAINKIKQGVQLFAKDLDDIQLWLESDKPKSKEFLDTVESYVDSLPDNVDNGFNKNLLKTIISLQKSNIDIQTQNANILHRLSALENKQNTVDTTNTNTDTNTDITVDTQTNKDTLGKQVRADVLFRERSKQWRSVIDYNNQITRALSNNNVDPVSNESLDVITNKFTNFVTSQLQKLKNYNDAYKTQKANPDKDITVAGTGSKRLNTQPFVLRASNGLSKNANTIGNILRDVEEVINSYNQSTSLIDNTANNVNLSTVYKELGLDEDLFKYSSITKPADIVDEDLIDNSTQGTIDEANKEKNVNESNSQGNMEIQENIQTASEIQKETDTKQGDSKKNETETLQEVINENQNEIQESSTQNQVTEEPTVTAEVSENQDTDENTTQEAEEIEPDRYLTRSVNKDVFVSDYKDTLNNLFNFKPTVDITEVRDLLNISNEEFNSKYNKAIRFFFSDDDKKEIKATLAYFNKAISNSLNSLINNPKYTAKLKDPRALEYSGNKIYLLTTKDDKGNYQFDKDFISKISLAFNNWITQTKVTKDTLKKFEGLLDEESIYSTRDAVDGFIREIYSVLGIEHKKDVPIRDSKGIFENLAYTIIKELSYDLTTKQQNNKPLLDRNNKPIITVDKVETVNYNLMNNVAVSEDFVDSIYLAKIFTSLFNNEKLQFYFEPVKSIPNTQKRSNVKLTNADKKAISLLQSIPHKINRNFYNFISKLQSVDNIYFDLLGYINENGIKNESIKESIKGKNISIKDNYNNTRFLVNMMDANNKTEVFYPYSMSSNGRFQQESNAGGQGNKIAREIFTATNSVLDLNKKEDNDLYLLALAQRSELVKVENNPTIESNVKEIQEKMEWYREAIDYIKNNAEIDPLEFKKALLNNDQNKTVFSEEFIHSLWSYAQYEAHDKSQPFETAIYYELDGKTNGISNMIANFSYLTNTNSIYEWIDSLQKSGIYIGGLEDSYNSFYNNNKEELGVEVDLYGTAGNRASNSINDIIKSYSFYKNFYSTYKNYLDINIMEGDKDEAIIALSRNTGKEAVTPIGYGSGMKSVNKDITNKVINKILLELEVLESKKDKNDLLLKLGKPLDLNTISEIIDLKENLTDKFIEKLEAFLENAFTSYLYDDSRNTFNNPIRTMNVPTVLSNIQSIIANEIYNEKLTKVNESKGGSKSKFLLSEDDINNILKDLNILLPTFNSQDLNLSFAPIKNTTNVGKQLDKKREGFISGQSLQGNNVGNVKLKAIEPSGVKLQPLLTIGSGDGNTMKNFVNNNMSKKDKDIVNVFDGLLVPVNKIPSYGQGINKSVYNSVATNKFKPLLENAVLFRNTINKLKLKNYLNERVIEDIKKAMFLAGFDNKKVTANNIDKVIEDLVNDLVDLYINTEAKNKVMSEIKITVDHMTGSHKGYIKDGKSFNTKEELVNYINKVIQSESVKIRDKVNKKFFGNRSKDNEYEEFKNTIKNVKDTVIGKDSNGIEYVEFKPNSVKEVLRKLYTNNTEQVRYMTTLLNKSNMSNISNIRIYNTDNSVTNDVFNENVYGYYDNDTKTINLNGYRKDILLHELTHGVTTSKLIDYYYNNSENLTDLDKKSIEHIVKLATKFGNSLGSKNLQVIKLKNFIKNKLASNNVDDTFNAVNEFIAYGLTDSEIIGELENINLNREETNIIKSLINVVVKWFGINRYNMYQALFGLTNNLSIAVNGKGKITKLVIDKLEKKERDTSEEPDKDPDPTTPKPKKKKKKIVKDIEQLAFDFNADNQTAKTIKDIKLENKVNKIAISVANGFNFVSQFTYNMVDSFSEYSSVNALLEASKNSEVFGQLQKLYSYVIKNINVQDIKDSLNVGASVNPDLYAQELYEALVGINADPGVNVLNNFITVSMLNKDASNYLKSLLYIQNKKSEPVDLIETIENKVKDLIDSLIDTRFNVKDNVQDNINMFVDLIKESVKQEDNIDLLAESNLSKSENKLVSPFISNLGSNISKFNKKLGLIVDKAINQEDVLYEGLLATINDLDKIPLIFRELFKEILGTNMDIFDVESLMKKSKFFISKNRQKFKLEVPKAIANFFSKDTIKEDFIKLNEIVLEYNTAGVIKLNTLIEYLNNPTRLNTDISNLENKIKLADNKRFNIYINKAKQLVNYLVTKEVTGNNLLKNAYAIMRIGSNKLVDNKSLEKDLEQLITLYHLQKMDNKTKSNYVAIYNKNKKGFNAVYAYAKALKETEDKKMSDNLLVKFNRLHNNNINLKKQNTHIIRKLNTPETKAKLISKGYVELQKDPNNINYSYYKTNIGNITYNQGIMQTVHQSAHGVDVFTGLNKNNAFIDFKKIVPLNLLDNKVVISNLIKHITKEGYVAVYNADGLIIGEEKIIPNTVKDQYKSDKQIHNILGVWKGRQIEEDFAIEYNKILVDRSYDLYRTSPDKKEGYVNIFDSKDPIIQESVRLIPTNTKKYLFEKFGDNTFYVRKDLVNQTLGYRDPSIVDVYGSNHRLNKELANTLAALYNTALGKNAYKYLLNGEKGLQSFVENMKNLIVVKSIIVPICNDISNMVQLLMYGINSKQILKDRKEYTKEIKLYESYTKRLIKLDVAIESTPVFKKEYEAEKQALLQNISKLKINKLLEQEYTSIAEGMFEDNAELLDGKLGDWIEQQVNKLPEELQKLGENLIISKNTKLYQGLNNYVKNSDFISKITLYNHLIKQGLSDKEAKVKIYNAFPNYDNMPGRVRTGLDKYGLTPFLTYKIGILKTAFTMLRDNPTSVILSNLAVDNILPHQNGIGTPQADNILSKGTNLGLPTDLLYGLTMNPWEKLLSKLL